MNPLEAETKDEAALVWLEILAENTPHETNAGKINVTVNRK